ncbi:hypothetical protein BU25DRAFT_423415 [Macroventuria anomochaeta]|uniref:Uncharacterized protein n=1 Tax=Macroventuria anomochaeta TaxID=301207 RepID=A0ACB6RU85_9PLEO|nr:uncharacterized protein BU25DRAFT_423415 [Macroventuria anomochaeta]KAF2625339.1 hypothetical protein BU25DRAFT_423415 [Macroventuria anomochaeta]
MTKDRFRAKPDNEYQPKHLQALNERADDQIAPKAAAQSIDTLQRWALATANIAQSGHRANESQTVERIRNRYKSEPPSQSLFQKLDLDVDAARPDSTLQNTASKERKHSISPAGSLQLTTLYSRETTELDARQAKRCRSKSPGVSSIDEDDTCVVE